MYRLRLCIYSDLDSCRKAVKYKISTKGQACLKTEKGLFFISITRRVTLNPHQRRSKTKFCLKSFGSLFFRKGTVLYSVPRGTTLSYRPNRIRRTLISAGDTPGILDAWAIVFGRIFCNFWRASIVSDCILL